MPLFSLQANVELPIPQALQAIIQQPLSDIDLFPYIQKIQNSPVLNTTWGNQFVFGWLASKKQNFNISEQQWQKVLGNTLPQDLNKALIKNLCKIYKALQSPVLLLMYEKYTESFPQEYDIPRVHLALVYHYLNLQVYERALYHCYKILNETFNIETQRLTEYSAYVTWAQLGIAQIYMQQKEYEKAFDFFSKIHLDNSNTTLNAEILLGKALCCYHSHHFDEAITLFSQYCSEGLDNIQTPQAYYYLIHCYKKQQDKENVLETIFKFMQLSQEKRTAHSEYWENWDKYQKMSAQEIAQDFYSEGNLIEAIKLYQALVDMNPTPHWQWPIICQLGLCYERLSLPIKSKAAYALIAHAEKEWNDVPIDWNNDLRNYQLQATWHLEQLETYEKIKLNFEQFAAASTKSPTAQ